MHIALGVHVSTYEVTASLVDTTLPELGPVATRTVTVAATPGGIGGAVSTALGFMRVQAMQHDLNVAGAAVVCENALQREIVADALAATESEPTPVVDIFDDRLSDAYTPDIAAALLVGSLAPAIAAPSSAREPHRGVWPIAAVGACVLAALGGVTAWAMTADPSQAGGSVPSEMVYPSDVPASDASPTRPASIPVGASTTAAPEPPIDGVPGADALPVDPGAVVVVPLAPVGEAAPQPEAGQPESADPGAAAPPVRPVPTEPGPTRPGSTKPSNGGVTTTSTIPETPVTTPTTTETTSSPSISSTTDAPIMENDVP
ncbi:MULTISPECIES: hypothetical protein [Nocardiaceae]|uniref:hypothetical protein n=1 Tax=Nocardiaceae TaxID=85025 RepID=UPI000381CB60|nr:MULTISPECIES: hypothetical protein [Rhodococcus]OZD17695.1 hypothetical protein CH280_07655 [Rhodococcus sp. 06-156-4C]OZD20271.1 hypothetical protein CH253_15095 [Rhodococcus sp. 06-156-3C]OZD21505.1 hypothetical protein CH248_10365 [Rhodococcus sp. 06-156-4a]OZD33291.1 hypothetical protein CH247_09195 [Rhodococcus sp. 06-156-3b]OZD40066.1 hypothetical protein CH284_03405 [Rhodococcus sp. 06-156-3]